MDFYEPFYLDGELQAGLKGEGTPIPGFSIIGDGHPILMVAAGELACMQAEVEAPIIQQGFVEVRNQLPAAREFRKPEGTVALTWAGLDTIM